MRQLLTALTLKPLSKIEVILSKDIAFVLVHAIRSPSGFEGISLNQPSYLE